APAGITAAGAGAAAAVNGVPIERVLSASEAGRRGQRHENENYCFHRRCFRYSRIDDGSCVITRSKVVIGISGVSPIPMGLVQASHPTATADQEWRLSSSSASGGSLLPPDASPAPATGSSLLGGWRRLGHHSYRVAQKCHCRHCHPACKGTSSLRVRI